MAKMKRVTLITQHYLQSKRKAGFHWLANAFWEAGWDVLFFTCYVSWFSWLRGARRFPRNVLYKATREARRIARVEDRMASYVWFTLWHPMNLRNELLNRLTAPLFLRYGDLPLGEAVNELCSTDLFIFEPTPGLLLFERLKAINPGARYVYRVSDDLQLLNRHPVVIEVEERISAKFDLVSAPSHYIYHRFSKLPQAKLHYHGVNLAIYNTQSTNPYSAGTTNVVFIGNSRFDARFLELASDLYPQWLFHIIGTLKNLPQSPNIIRYGEMPFKATVPYVKYADIGLHTLVYSPGAESFTDSLKVQQYTYCNLPIVAPDFLKTDHNNMFYYSQGDRNTIKTGLGQALAFKRAGNRAEDAKEIQSWTEVAAELAGARLW